MSPAATNAQPPVHVLYFAGTGRSGTTVLNSILGQLPEVFAAGELRYLWQRGLEQDHLCGCGQPFGKCPVWTDVMRRVKGCEDPPPGGYAMVGRRLLLRLRMARLPGMLLRHATGRRPVPSHGDDVTVSRLYQAIAERTGARLVVDTSKLPPYGLLLDRLAGVQMSVVHLVRDPRATAYSWRRQKATKDPGQGAQMQRLELWKSSLLWTVWNLTASWVWPDRRTRVLRLRYEDFVSDPVGELHRLVAFAGEDPADLPFVGDCSVNLDPTHAVAGNPNRHTTGIVRLRADDEWRGAMGAPERLLVTALTAPGLVRFGYPLRTRTGSAAVRRPLHPHQIG